MANNQENRRMPRKDYCYCRLHRIHQGLVFLYGQGPGPGHGLAQVPVKGEIS